jgi:hypothetical protein
LSFISLGKPTITFLFLQVHSLFLLPGPNDDHQTMRFSSW